MREAVGQTFLYNVVIVLILITMLVLVGSLSYSKGFKAKNKIVSIIENNLGYDDDTMEQIDNALKESGYRPKNSFRHQDCPDRNGELLTTSDRYPYCVYANTTDKGVYYSVTIYIRFEIPLLSGILEFPVNGDTRTIYDLDIST